MALAVTSAINGKRVVDGAGEHAPILETGETSSFYISAGAAARRGKSFKR